jgi:hypothetical protein
VLSLARSSRGSLNSTRAKSQYVVSSPRLASRPEEEEEEEEEEEAGEGGFTDIRDSRAYRK